MEASKEAEEAAHGFKQEVTVLMKKYGISSLVMSANVRPGEVASIWIPGCGPDCTTPNDCLAANLQLAAENLMDTVDRMMDDGEIGETMKVH